MYFPALLLCKTRLHVYFGVEPDLKSVSRVEQEVAMDTVKEVLLRELKKLKADEFDDFKYYLQEFGSKAKTALSKDGHVLEISPCDLENADRRRTVDLITQTYSDQPLQVTWEVLKKVGRNDLMENLNQSRTEGKATNTENVNSSDFCKYKCNI